MLWRPMRGTCRCAAREPFVFASFCFKAGRPQGGDGVGVAPRLGLLPPVCGIGIGMHGADIASQPVPAGCASNSRKHTRRNGYETEQFRLAPGCAGSVLSKHLPTRSHRRVWPQPGVAAYGDYHQTFTPVVHTLLTHMHIRACSVVRAPVAPHTLVS